MKTRCFGSSGKRPTLSPGPGSRVPGSRPPLYLRPTPHPRKPAPFPRGRRRARLPHLRRLGGAAWARTLPRPPLRPLLVRSGSGRRLLQASRAGNGYHLSRAWGGGSGAVLFPRGPAPAPDSVPRRRRRGNRAPFRALPPSSPTPGALRRLLLAPRKHQILTALPQKRP